MSGENTMDLVRRAQGETQEEPEEFAKRVGIDPSEYPYGATAKHPPGHHPPEEEVQHDLVKAGIDEGVLDRIWRYIRTGLISVGGLVSVGALAWVSSYAYLWYDDYKQDIAAEEEERKVRQALAKQAKELREMRQSIVEEEEEEDANEGSS